MGCPMAGSVAVNGPSSMIAACKDRQPASWLFAISRFPARNTRPCVSLTVKTELGEIRSIILSCEAQYTAAAVYDKTGCCCHLSLRGDAESQFQCECAPSHEMIGRYEHST